MTNAQMKDDETSKRVIAVFCFVIRTFFIRI